MPLVRVLTLAGAATAQRHVAAPTQYEHVSSAAAGRSDAMDNGLAKRVNGTRRQSFVDMLNLYPSKSMCSLYLLMYYRYLLFIW
jgi:hypothetical protein